MAAPDRGEPGVYLEGLSDLRKVLRKIDKNLDKNLAASLRAIGKNVQGETRAEARRFRDSGDLERSVRYSVTVRSASVYSNSPYSAVHQWGGSVRPRGVPISVPRRMWMTKGVQNARRDTDRDLLGLLDKLADDWSA